MGVKYNSNESDTNSDIYESGRKTVNTTGIFAAVGSQAADGRQFVSINNISSVTIYFGPASLPFSEMDTIRPKQRVEIAASPDLEITLKTETGTADVIIQEIG